MSSKSKSKPESKASAGGSKQAGKSDNDESLDYDKGKKKSLGETVSLRKKSFYQH